MTKLTQALKNDGPEKRNWSKCVFLPLLIAYLFLWPAPGRAETPYSYRCIAIIDKDDFGNQIQYPSALYFDPQRREVYVSCSGERKLLILTSDFYPLISLGTGRGIKNIKSCCLYQDRLLICPEKDSANEKAELIVLDQALLPAGSLRLKDIPGEINYYPYRLLAIDNLLFVIGQGRQGVLVFDENANFLREIKPSKKVLGIKEAASIQAFTADSSGKIFMVSEAMGAIFIYRNDGHLIKQFGQKGGTAGKLSRPRGIAVDDHLNLIYVVDYMRHAVNVYDKEGEYLFEIGGQGVGRGWFSFPSDACVDNQGRLWVADTFNQRVQVFSVHHNGQDNQPRIESKPSTEKSDNPTSTNSRSFEQTNTKEPAGSPEIKPDFSMPKVEEKDL